MDYISREINRKFVIFYWKSMGKKAGNIEFGCEGLSKGKFKYDLKVEKNKRQCHLVSDGLGLNGKARLNSFESLSL